MRTALSPLLLALALVAACDAVTQPEVESPRPSQAIIPAGQNSVSVLTQNLFVGTDLGPVAAASPSQVPLAAAAAWQKVLATDFSTRVQGLADEIARTRPQLIGLQEVTTWRTQTPSDFVLGHYQPNATVVAYDYLQILLDALADRGLDYRVAALAPTSDLELPAYTGVGAIPFTDIRWSDADALLVRSDVDVHEGSAHQFNARTSAGGLTRIDGWAAARVNVGGRELMVVTTHLLKDPADVQVQQTAELLDWINGQDLPVLLVGDFNSAANPGAPAADRTGTYGMLRDAGFTDLWARGNLPESGLTAYRNGLLTDPSDTFNQRLDLVLLNQGLGRLVGNARMQLIGTNPDILATYGLWPSDHAGLFAVLDLPVADDIR